MQNGEFEKINLGFNNTFRANKLSIGLVAPIEEYAHSIVPTMIDQLKIIKMADELGFSAVWLRDIPFEVPSFGDVGQIFDPWVYLGLLAGATERITLGIASAILPLRHPAHLAKAAASVDQLSGGRFVLGVASGDRPYEYPAMNIEYEDRGHLFRESFEYIRKATEMYPRFKNSFGELRENLDIIPKPHGHKLPLLITGHSQQSYEWIVNNGDGWMNYPKNMFTQKDEISRWRQSIFEAGLVNKPAMQPLYIDLLKDEDKEVTPIHLGFRSNASHLVEYLKRARENGVNHVAINLKFNKQNIEKTLEILAQQVLPEFN